MTLAKGNILVKANEDGEPVTGESYHEFEVVDLTSSQALASLLGKDRSVELGGDGAGPLGEIYQLVLLRVRD